MLTSLAQTSQYNLEGINIHYATIIHRSLLAVTAALTLTCDRGSNDDTDGGDPWSDV